MKFTKTRAVAALLALSSCAVLSACSTSGIKREQPSSQPSAEASSAATAGEESSSQETPPQTQPTMQEEIVTITAYDGLTFEGKLRLPEGEAAWMATATARSQRRSMMRTPIKSRHSWAHLRRWM